jgi:hypothetical protein
VETGPDRATCQLPGPSTRRSGLLAAPDAPLRGAAGQALRLFELFKGPHWTLLGYDVARGAVPPRPGLHIHAIGTCGDIVDANDMLRDAYVVTSGDWVLVRPDGYIGDIVSGETAALETHLRKFASAQGAA